MSSETSTSDGFHVNHFFVLLSLIAATVAVLMARPSAPEHLILISLTIGAAGLTALCVYRTLAPLVAPHADFERQALSARMRLDLEREKALTLRSIKELEFDRAMAKVSPQDFDEMAGRLRARAVGIMKQLDAGSSAYRVLIERELAVRVGPSQGAARPDLKIERQGGEPHGSVPSQAPRTVGGAPVATVAPLWCACGVANDADARFCKSCGTPLRAA